MSSANLEVLINENKTALEQLEHDIDHIISTIVNLNMNMIEQKRIIKPKDPKAADRLVKLYFAAASVVAAGLTEQEDNKDPTESMMREVDPAGAALLQKLKEQVRQCSEEAIKNNQIKNIQDLNQLMKAFHVFAEKMTSKKPILEDILESLIPLTHRPVGIAERVIPLLCGVVGEFLVNVVVGLLRGCVGALIGLTGIPLFAIMGSCSFNTLFVTIPVLIACFLPFSFLIPYFMVLQGINVLLGAGYAIITGYREIYNDIYVSSRNCLFFQPPPTHEAIRNDIRSLANNDAGFLKKFLKHETVLERVDIHNGLNKKITKYTSMPIDVCGIISSYASHDTEKKSATVDMQVRKICAP